MEKEIKLKKITLLPLIFIFYLFLSVFFSKYKFAAAGILYVLVINFIFFMLYSNSENINTEKILKFFVYSCLPFAFIGIFQSVGIDFPKGLLVFGKNIPATFGNPNFFAAYIIGIFPVLMMLFYKDTGFKKYLFFSLIILFIFLLYKTGSKAGLLAFFTEIFLLIFFSESISKKSKIIIIVLIFIISLVIFIKIFNVPVNKIIERKEWLKNESVFFRVNVWHGTIKLIKKYFLTGCGPGSFAYVFPFFKPEAVMFWAKEHSYEIVYPENIFLQIMAETGICGFLIFLFLLIILYKNFNIKNKYFFISITGILFLNLFSVDLNYITSIFLISFLAGNIFIKKEDDFFVLNGRTKKIIFIFLIFITICIFYFQVKNFISDSYLQGAIWDSKQKKWEYAIEKYKKALSFNKNNIVAQYFLANSLYDNGDLYGALKTYEELDKKVPGYILTNYKKANILNRIDNIESAKKEYKKAISLDPYLKEALLELAFIYYNEKNFSDAESLIKKGLKKYNDAALYNNLGNIYFSSGKIKEAIESYKKAIEIKEDKDYYYNLGCVYFVLKDYKKAKENFEKAYSLKNDDEKIINMLKTIKRYDITK